MTKALLVGSLTAFMALLIWPSRSRPIPRTATTQRSFERADSVSRLSRRELAQTALVGLVSGCLGFLLGDLIGAVIGTLAASCCWLLTIRSSRQDRRRNEALQAQAAATFDLLACALSAGQPLARAVETVAAISAAPTSELLTRVAAHLRIGCCQREAWDALRHEAGWQDVARDLAASAETGAGLAELLTAAACEAREQSNAQVQTKARAVNVRSVLPMMCCFLPSFVLVGVVPIVAGVLSSGLLRP